MRGTRPRAPAGPRDARAMLLLVVAALLHLPIVYLLVGDARFPPTITLGLGLLSMGLAWSGGVALEGRRRGTVRALAALGVAEGALVFVPALASALGDARWLFVGISVLCGCAFASGRK